MGNSQLDTNLQGYENEEFVDELIDAKFKYFAKESFLEAIKYKTDYSEFVKRLTHHFATKLPEELNDFFLQIDTAPFFWTVDTKIIKLAEKFSGRNLLSHKSLYDQIKRFYSKWITQKTDKEQNYFALSTINLINRDLNKDNFLNKILYAMILGFDKRIFSPDKSVVLFNESLSLLDKADFNENTKREFQYLLELFKGFVHFRNEAIKEADEIFSNAKSTKQNGTSAMFYLALTKNYLNDENEALENLKKIMEFDKMRLKFAFEQNSLSLFDYFIKNAITYNIFKEKNFAPLLPEIELSLSEIFPRHPDLLFYNNKLNKFEMPPIRDFLNEKLIKRLSFLHKFNEFYSLNKNKLVNVSGELVSFATQDLKNEIQKLIEGHFSQKIEDILEIFDYKLSENTFSIKKYKKEKINAENIHKERERKTIERIQNAVKETIAVLEYKIEHLEDIKKYDAGAIFNSMLINSIIISIIVFIIGGFIGGTMGNSNFGGSINSEITKIILSGLKWGGVTFLLGILVSVFSGISAIVEKSNTRQKLLKEISFVKKQSQKEISYFKEKSQHKLKLLLNLYEDKISSLESANQRIIIDKEKRLDELQKDTKKEIDGLVERLNAILTDDDENF